MPGRSKRDRDTDDLTLREQLFCAQYLLGKCSNGAEAIRRAGYKGDARKRACQLLQRPRIVRVIEREKQRLLNKFEITKEKVLRELARVAFLDPRDLCNADGSFKNLSDLDADTAAAISGVDYKAGGVVKIRCASKLAALDLLGRWLHLWEGAGDRSGKDKLDELLKAMQQGPVENNEDDDIPTIQ
jgi:phage terminase small subunit